MQTARRFYSSSKKGNPDAFAERTESHRLPSAWPPSARGNLGFASTAARTSSPGSSPGYMNSFKQFAISGGDSVRPSFQPTALASPPHARL